MKKIIRFTGTRTNVVCFPKSSAITR